LLILEKTYEILHFVADKLIEMAKSKKQNELFQRQKKEFIITRKASMEF
jgi:hypothetical protein